MKTDKELLELAAKAAGLNVKMIEVDQDDNFSGLIVGRRGTKERVWWNPLKSNGDALRLAVALRLLIDTDYNDCVAAGCCQLDEVLEPIGNDRLAATRRAIVRAAAAIGERL